VPTIIENKIINNKDYCVMSITDHAMGKFGTDYRYSTPSTSGTKTAEFLVVGSVCTSILSFDESKTEEDVANCQAEQANFGSKLDKAIDSLMR
jgi:hypothetical protein